ncbi:hypothetical protein ACFW9I_35870 [[Kitasatospora] papulosa]|uniref:hypothetical protein n=1 Tax=[Kitasatospora] papulosa TaxID=1464011 RepID=UPI0036BD0FDF
MRKNNLIGVIPDGLAEQEVNGEKILIGRWMWGLRNKGRLDPEGKIEGLLNRWTIPYEPNGNKIKVASTVATANLDKKYERWRSHLESYDAWVAKDPQRSGTITGGGLRRHNELFPT